MEPDFVIIKHPDPLAILVESFPEVQDHLLPEDADYGTYYVYGRFAEYLASRPKEEPLWFRAYEFFEILAKGGSATEGLLADVFEALCSDAVVAQKLKKNLGPAARTILNQTCPEQSP